MTAPTVRLSRAPSDHSSESSHVIEQIDERISAKIVGNVVPFPVAPLSAEGIEAQKLARIRAFAKHINSERHLDAILADIPDLSTRVEVRTLIVPMLSFTVSEDVD